MSVWGDILGAIQAAGGGGASGLAPAAAQGEGVLGLFEATDTFFGDITDSAMWKSLGWIAVGAILMILGLILWLKKDNYIPDAVPLPVPV